MGNIFDGFNTDKENPHNYSTCVYEDLLTPVQRTVQKVLEIGVFRGGSLQAWKNFFPNAQVIGFDISPMYYGEDRIQVVSGDQGNPHDLRALGEAHGPFDLVVDDGSHLLNHQFTSLMYLWEYVSPGGLYVIEDVCNKELRPTLEQFPGASCYFTGDLQDDFVWVLRKV